MAAKKRGTGDGARSTRRSEVHHDDVMRASQQVDPELRQRSQLLWEDRTPGSRGPKAAVSPDDVVQAAMEIADADGLSAVTMAAVAARLGFTTMALYRYFPNKEMLLDAVIDAGTGTPPRLTTPRKPWRVEVSVWAHAKRQSLCERPWLAELPFVAAPHGPNWLLWLESITDILSRTGLNAQDVGGALSAVDGYTRGASDTAVSLARAKRRGVTDAEWAAGVGADLGRAVGDPRFPSFAALITAPSDGAPRTLVQGFDWGLERVLDGIEAYIERR